MAGGVNFRQLIDAARRRGRSKYQPPRTMHWVGTRCRISVPHLYNLINGEKVAQECTVHRIARGLDVSSGVVQRALDRSRAEALSA